MLDGGCVTPGTSLGRVDTRAHVHGAFVLSQEHHDEGTTAAAAVVAAGRGAEHREMDVVVQQGRPAPAVCRGVPDDQVVAPSVVEEHTAVAGVDDGPIEIGRAHV